MPRLGKVPVVASQVRDDLHRSIPGGSWADARVREGDDIVVVSVRVDQGVLDGLASVLEQPRPGVHAQRVRLGIYMLRADEDAEGEKVASLTSRSGVALIGLGVGISLDELAMGFTIGLLHLSLVLAVILIGVQAFLVAQLGLRLGARLGEPTREWAERLAGIALIGLGALVLIEQLLA